MKKNKATIIHHQGYGDLITNNSLVNYYSNQYDELVVFALDHSRKEIIDYMYKDKKNITCVIPKLNSDYDNDNSCIICHMSMSSSSCPRDRSTKCKHIDYQNYSNYDNIKIGCFNDYKKWDNYLSDKNNISFSHSFYTYNNLDLSVRIDNFNIYRDLSLENDLVKNLNLDKTNYLVIHDDGDNGININKDFIKNKGDVYQLNKTSKNMLDQIMVIENSKEIHMIDSNYSVLIYFLSFYSEKIKNIPKYLHSYPRKGRDIGIYTNPTPNNWYVLD